MKLICSILILAGVFALNDAFPSSEADDAQMRLLQDQMTLRELSQIAQNRASSTCAPDYLEKLTKIVATYTDGLKDCDDTSQTAIDALNKDANEKLGTMTSKVSDTCKNSCSSGIPSDDLPCMASESSTNSRVLSDISLEAESLAVNLLNGIENAQSTYKVCKTTCQNVYSKQSQDVEDEFAACVKKEEGGK